MVKISPIRVADEGFLVGSMIERCPKTMMLRELFQNAVEAAITAPDGQRNIEIRSVNMHGVDKLAIWNTGRGLSAEELREICDIASSLNKVKGLDANFGMGAKVASLPSNKIGLRYRSCRHGLVSQVILREYDGTYGRALIELEDGDWADVIDVTDEYDAFKLSFDWTEVVLGGNRPDQNTIRDPYNGDPEMPVQWIADYLYHRYYRLPSSITVKMQPETHKLDSARTFKTIPERKDKFGRTETVQCDSGICIHYYYDPPLSSATSHNKSISGSLTSDVSLCCVVFRNEMYDVKKKRQWTFDAPIFGIPFGPRHISVHIELPDNYPVLPDGYRQFLRYKDGDQRQVCAVDFADLVRAHRPQWLIDIINSLAPAGADGEDEIREELQKLLNSLRVKSRTPRIDSDGDVNVDFGQGNGARSVRDGVSGGQGSSTGKHVHQDIFVAPAGAKRAIVTSNAERAPEIIPLWNDQEVEEKGFRGKAAKFYKDTSMLFINMNYPSVKDMQELLEQEYASAPDPELLRKMAKQAAERTIMVKVGRAVVYALAKQLNRDWTTENMTQAQSPESLSLAADDFIDAMQNARRRIGIALRIARSSTDDAIPEEC